jgi:prepilin-type N-terminal cleavage/methylation domain-containing protein
MQRQNPLQQTSKPVRSFGPQQGFTLLELFIVIIILGILVGMILPVTRSVREPARRTVCMNHQRQIILACLNYESAHMRFPSAMGGPHLTHLSAHDGVHRASGYVSILPYLEQLSLYEQITQPGNFGGVDFPAIPSPTNANYPPYQAQPEVLLCPSAESVNSPFGQTNYAFCIGDAARNIHNLEKARGVFAPGLHTTIADLKDGSSNTIAFAEMGTSPAGMLNSHYAVGQSAEILDDPSKCKNVIGVGSQKYGDGVRLGSPGRGGCWADGAAGYSLVNTILPPNRPSCAVESMQPSDGIYSAGSFHNDLAVVAFADGSTHAIPEDIDCGESGHPTLHPDQWQESGVASPYGVWGAWGTIDGEEVHQDW